MINCRALSSCQIGGACIKRTKLTRRLTPLTLLKGLLRNNSSRLALGLPRSTISHFCGFFTGVLKRKLRVPDTRRSVLAKKPSGYADSRYMWFNTSPTPTATQLLTMVYHSMIRGNNGRGIVKAKRSNSKEIKTTLSTLVDIADVVGVVTVGQRSGSEDL
jgi:hypothetical protein